MSTIIGIDESGNMVIGEKARAQYLLSPFLLILTTCRGRQP